MFESQHRHSPRQKLHSLVTKVHPDTLKIVPEEKFLDLLDFKQASQLNVQSMILPIRVLRISLGEIELVEAKELGLHSMRC